MISGKRKQKVQTRKGEANNVLRRPARKLSSRTPRFVRGEGSAFSPTASNTNESSERLGAAPFAPFKGCGFRVNSNRGVHDMHSFPISKTTGAMANEK
jgi:hypothetical protein